MTAEEQAFHHPGQDVSPTAMSSNMSKLPALPPLPTLKGDDSMSKTLLQQQLQHHQASMPGALSNFHRMQELQMQQQMQLHQQQQQAAAAAQQQQQQQQQQQMPTVSAQPQQMQQAHAIHYVTKIRNRFSAEPDTYRSGFECQFVQNFSLTYYQSQVLLEDPAYLSEGTERNKRSSGTSFSTVRRSP